MLVGHRHVRLLDSDASRSYSALFLPGFRAYVARATGLVYRVGPVHRLAERGVRNVALVLSGEMVVWRDGRDVILRPGDWIYEAPLGDERWSGDPFEVLVVEWDPALGPGVSHGPGRGFVTPIDRRHLRRSARHLLETPPDSSAARAVAEVLVRTIGLDIDLPAFTPEPTDQSIATALGSLLSRLDGQPMWTDLEGLLGLSERHLRRLVGDYLDRYMTTEAVGGFRDYVRVHRLSHAMAFMTADDAHLAQVAASVGYGSARAMCTAFRRAGLPSPASVRRAWLHGD